MTAYISVSYSKRKELKWALDAMVATLRDLNIDAFIFATAHTFTVTQENQMMLLALAEIDRCDIFIAETSDKAIGIGIEAGYAKAKGKPVIYTRQITAEHSTTLSGISDYHFFYNDTNDLQHQLAAVINKIMCVEK